MFFRGETFADLFLNVRRELINAPLVNVRGFLTKEILPAQLELVNPRSRLIYHQDRIYNLPFNIAEMLSYVGGINSVGFLSFFNKKIADYSDNGFTFYGAYGPRLKPYFNDVISKLKSDKHCRQAVMTIFKSDDMKVRTKDVPCTIALDFKIRNDKLILHTMMRSNDLIWGLQYDLFAFTIIQELIANEIGIDVGSYYHTATSLHVYDYHWDLLDKMDEKTVESVECDKIGVWLKTATQVAEWAYRMSLGGSALPFDGIQNVFSDVIYNHRLKKLQLHGIIRPTPDWVKKFVK